MCFGAIFGGGGSSGTQKIADAQRADEVARQQRITSGMSSIDQAFAGFNDDYYNKRASDYSAYAMPEVDKQAKETRDQLIYALSRSGNLDSSAALKKSADLTQAEDAARINVANEGLNQENQLRNQVENARGNVVAELNATGDSSAASNSALRDVQNLNQPAGFSPMGNLFASFAQGIGSIGANSGNGYSGFIPQARSLFSSPSASSRVVSN